MSILKKPYEISVWDDVWNPTLLKFEEKRLGIIGSNGMLYQGRAIEPNLVRNVNGTKKFSFKMYKYFVDNETGEKVENPFINWLVNERKVKLHYKGKWYDFIVKNIVENSSNYLYTYQLEDALALELSKNGFGVTLDTKLMNNMGTAKELAEYVLEETDWNVTAEAFVEQVEDNLVYVKMPENISALNIYRIKDQVIVSGEDNEDGIEEILLTETTDIKKSDLSGKEILAFYTSCTNKPNRFQFIYIPEGYYKADNNGKCTPSVSTDKNQIINVKDCQYYCEIDKPELDGEYVKSESFPQFYLPKNFTVANKGQSGISNSNDTTISVWYRGKRYGFAQSAKYIPLLDRYCNEYTKGTTKYYGFVDNDYASPALLQNIITNTEFKGTTGWVGTYSGSTPNAKANFGAEVEVVYGRFNINNKFSSVIDELSNGTYDSDNEYTAYLKVIFPAYGSADKAILLNTGFYDNRTLIKQVNYDEEWYFNADITNSNGATVNAFTVFDFALREVSFNPASGIYVLGDIWATLSNTTKQINGETVHFFKFNSESQKNTSGYADVEISENDFKKKEIKLVITPKSNSTKTTYYIKNMQLFKLVLNDESKIIKPGDVDTEGAVKTTYRFFPAAYVQEIEGSSIDVVTDAKNISYENFDKPQIDYSVYKPKYNVGAQKVRSVDEKESNYFNILQQIAETFEVWLDLEIERDDFGGIISKTAKFKNYVGKNNHAAFRYGVNLKDIQRTYESKNIVTKLIVKQNSNEHAQNGFCTIARAGSNQTGENYIYDFRYFHDREMLDKAGYVSSLYYGQNPLQPEDSAIIEEGPDLGEGHESEKYNLQNYFNRVRNLNTKIEDINKTIIPSTTELTKYKAELQVQTGLRDAASEGIDEVREDFAVLTGGLTPETISQTDFSRIICNIPDKNAEATTNSGAGVNKLNSGDWAQDASVQAINMQEGVNNSTEWKFNISLNDIWTKCSGISYLDYSGGKIEDGVITVTNNLYSGVGIKYKYQQNKRYRLTYTLKGAGTTLLTVGGHDAPFSNKQLTVIIDGIQQPTISTSYQSISLTKNSDVTIIQEGTYTLETVDELNNIGTNCFFIQPNRNKEQGFTCTIENIELKELNANTSSRERTIYIQPTFTLTPNSGSPAYRLPKISCTIPAYSNTGTKEYSLAIVDTTAQNISSLLTEYATYLSQYNESIKQIDGYTDEDGVFQIGLEATIAVKETEITEKQKEIDNLLEHKKVLNQLFYSRYSRFIQEGTWMDEKYIDDDKYYADAQSVMYNSCYPQVAYNINVIALDASPGYEGFDFELGDKTYAIDPEFFGEDYQEEVIVNEMSTNLDDPTKDQIKVQNFKNQFQDLFQKITATVQQAQYSTGSYEKAVALAEANAAIKSEFLQDAFNDASSRLTTAGQTSVVQGADGITLTDEATKDQMRLIGGAILMSVEDENGQRKWKTGLTPDGISASLVTAGTINTGNISIMNGKDATFMWNAYGLSAFDTDWTNGEITGTPKKNKFVRFDKYGIYGINDNGADSVDGTTWKPTSNDEIDDKATFALTWEGLKITGNNGVIAKIGKDEQNIISITKTINSEEGIKQKDILTISNEGALSLDYQATDFEGQDNLLLRSRDFFHSSWKELDDWTEAYDPTSQMPKVDSLGNLVRSYWAQHSNGNFISRATGQKVGLGQYFSAEANTTYYFSFNASSTFSGEVQGYTTKETDSQGNTIEGQWIYFTIPENKVEHTAYTLGGKEEKEVYDVILVKKDDSKIIQTWSFSEVTNLEKRLEFNHTITEEGSYAFLIRYAHAYPTEPSYRNANVLYVSSMKVTKVPNSNNWCPNPYDMLNNEIRQNDYFETKIANEKGTKSYNIVNYSCFTSSDNSIKELWDSNNYGKLKPFTFSRTITPGTYLLSLTAKTDKDANNYATGANTKHTIIGYIMPIIKTDKGALSASWDYYVSTNSSFDNTSYSYVTFTKELLDQVVGWRITITNEPKPDEYIGKVFDFQLSSLAIQNTSNIATRAELKTSTEGMVANTYAPNETGFGWSLTPNGFYLKSYEQVDGQSVGKNVFSVSDTGQLSWGDSPVRTLYSAETYQPEKPQLSYDEYKPTTGIWHQTYSTRDIYKCISYSMGTRGTWGPVERIKGEKGDKGADGSNGGSATVDYNSIYNAFEKADPGLIPFTLEDGTQRLFIKADAINTGALRVGSADNLVFYAAMDGTDVKLAGWTVNQNQISALFDKKDITQANYWKEGKNYLVFGMQNKAGKKISTVNALAIGQIEKENDWSDADFRVTHDGALYCKNIQATGGKIGNMTINYGPMWNTNEKDITYLCIDGDNNGSNFYLRSDGFVGYYVGSYNSRFGITPECLVVEGLHGNKKYATKLYPHGLESEDTLTFKDSTGEVKLSDLVFKGPYDIKMGSTVIGKIGQLGPIVYGYIDSTAFETYTNNTTLTIGGTISAPKSTMNIPIPYSSGNKTCVMEISTDGTFKLTEYWNSTDEMNDNGTIYGYFCYSVGSHALM